MPTSSTTSSLRRLERIARHFGAGEAAQKLRLLRQLGRARLTTTAQVRRLHEVICFLRAFPDDALVLAEVERLARGFGQRRDVARLREALADSGIAGTPIQYQFHWPTARWLANHWPRLLTVDWEWFEDAVDAVQLIDLLVPRTEAIDHGALGLSTREWLDRLKAPDQTDACFLVRRFEKLAIDDVMRQTLYETLDLPMRLAAGPTTPSRTRAKLELHAPVYQRTPLVSSRPQLATAIRVAPRWVRDVTPARAEALIFLAREAMVSRARDLDAIQHANPDDVRLIDAGDGLMLSCIGLAPGRRPLVETVYVFVLHKNGVPIGYFQSALLFGSAELNYNIFEPFRGTEAAQMYARSLAIVHHMFGADVFAVDPYQLGQDNAEALASGAFWFYEKLGFQPEDPGPLAALARERRRLAKDPRHRSTPTALRELADGYVFYYLDRRRDDVAGKISLDRIGLAINTWVGARWGDDREGADIECARLARAALGIGNTSRWTPSEHQWFARWSALVCMLRVETWSTQERRNMTDLILAKAAPRDDPFARRLTAHTRLRRALVRLSRRPV